MVGKKQDSIMTIEEWEAITRELIAPIDFESLINSGVLEKRKGWYKILKLNKLPPHAKAKIHKLQTSSDGGVLVKFQEPSKKLEKMLTNYESRKKPNRV
jgi:hypothetical protein